MLEMFTEHDLKEVILIHEHAFKIGIDIIKKLKSGTENVIPSDLREYAKCNPFQFKGDSTDLSYYWKVNKIMPSLLEQIPDKQLREAVIKNFGQYLKDNLIKVHNGAFVLTPKGVTHITDPNFIERVIKSDIDLNAKIEKGITQILTERSANTLPDNPVDINSRKEVMQKAIDIVKKDKNPIIFYDEKTSVKFYLNKPNDAKVSMDIVSAQNQKLNARCVYGSYTEGAYNYQMKVMGGYMERLNPGYVALKVNSSNPEINFNDSTLGTENEIIYEAGKKAKQPTPAPADNTVPVFPTVKPLDKNGVPLKYKNIKVSIDKDKVGIFMPELSDMKSILKAKNINPEQLKQGIDAMLKTTNIVGQKAVTGIAGASTGGVALAVDVGKEVLTSGFRFIENHLSLKN